MNNFTVNAFLKGSQNLRSLWEIPILDSSPSELDALLHDSAWRGVVHLVNVHTLVESTENANLREAFLAPNALNLADGAPVGWRSGARRHPGPDLMEQLLGRYPKTEMTLIGGATTEVGQALIRRFGLRATKAYSPPFRSVTRETVEEDLAKAGVRESKPRWIWVGLGAPKQELWMRWAAEIFPDAIYFGVGAAFDFLSGEKPRAPEWLRSAGLEWAHRWWSEPRRLGGRYLRSNSRFLIRTMLGKK